MKIFWLISVVCVTLVMGCRNGSENSVSHSKAKGKSGKKSERDLSITKANAYSDLFLDSTTVEKFISDQKLKDSLANDLRRFYNLRNFQFAWFSSDGPNEQTLSFRSLYDYDKDSGVSRKSLDNRLDDILTNDSLREVSADSKIANAGGFPPVKRPDKVYKKGNKGQVVKSVKQRLATEGLFPSNDTSEVFNEDLENVVKSSQARYGLTSDGKIGKGWVKELNVPVGKRIEQMLINMERMKWMPEEPEGRLIMVNIPEFRLHVRDRKSEAFDMDIVVGKEGSNTIIFSGTLNQIVFNPYWNVPRSIVTKEVIPGMESNDAYLADHQMEITGEEDGLPVVRQLPGDLNALGRVKFLFPNTYNIYFHDTPEKELFKKTKRAYSHGCIRLSDPMKMANYLLEEDTDWNSTKIDSLLATDEEKYVKLKDPVPVIITYYTCWINDDGKIEFREDIYNRDKKMSRKLFAQPAGNPDKLALK
ncbi:MAG TPA: L,D-transpeptidase family protein [Flavitalea sp.]|nr:L,D-transpeptidase family protein [Flavitalea sp.]